MRWNFDKFMIDAKGKSYFYATAKEVKPLALAADILKRLKK